MSIRSLLLCVFAAFAVPAMAADAPVSVASAHSADETLARLEAAIAERNMKLFTVIDHQEAAKEAGLEMPAASVVIFGAPKNGTPQFIKAPTLAIDLPLRVLVYEDAAGDVFVAYSTGDWLGEDVFARHGLNMGEGARNGMSNMLATLVEGVTAP